jgi:pimeloyl-ACP methyl ester carboxylesterase
MLAHAECWTNGRHCHEALYSLAELNYLGAQAVSGRDAPLASELYLDSAQWAWDYFATTTDEGRLPDPVAPEHRATADVYNASCEALLRIARKHGRYCMGQSWRMPLTGRSIDFEIPFPSRLVCADSVGEFEFVSDFRITNLRNHHTSQGLGVPVIAVRKPSATPDPMQKYYAQGMSCATTLVFRFPEGSAGRHDRHSQTIRLQAFDPRESDGFQLGNALLPLESDLSTPLARFLSNPDLRLLDTWGFLRPDRVRSVEGLYMVQPYDPDRIPVLMVHGLWSSPMTWMEMFNDLQADPEIRRRYQFWFYLYPTGEPLAFAAANLREELKDVRNDCDPSQSNVRMDQMVMVGHSMGGLMSHLLTIDSGERLWNSISSLPLEQLRAEPEQKNEIRRVFFFESDPAVSRIVTIASPYGGSRYSNALTRWLGSSIVWLPSRTLQLSRLVFQQNNSGLWDRVLPQPTSLDSLAGKSAVLTLIRETRVPQDVQHHNIVGIQRGKSDADWTDGVVTFASAHRPDVASELTVPAGHSEVHRHPRTIDEVRRILIVHLNDIQRRRFPVIPVKHAASPPGTTSATWQTP